MSINCPSENCGARVNTGQQLFDHYSSYHKPHIIRTMKFNVPRVVFTRWDKIIKEFDNFYIFRMSVLGDDAIKISVEYVGGDYEKPPKFKLLFSTDDYEIEHHYSIINYDNSVSHNYSRMDTINMKDIKKELKHRNVRVELTIDCPPDSAESPPLLHCSPQSTDTLDKIFIFCPQRHCSWRLTTGMNLYKHYSKHHKPLIMGTRKFNVPRNVGTHWDKLLKEFDNYYFFRMTVSDHDEIKISLEYVRGDYPKPANFKMLFTTEKYEIEHHYNIINYDNSVSQNYSRMYTINMKNIKDELKHNNVLVELILDCPPDESDSDNTTMGPPTTPYVPPSICNLPPPTSNVPPPTPNIPHPTPTVSPTTHNVLQLHYSPPSVSTGAIKKIINETTNATKSIEEELECPICNIEMKSPIYLCATGHSICNECKPKLSKCPFCKKHIGEGRNFTLEKLSDTLLKLTNLNTVDDNEIIHNNSSYKKEFSCPLCFLCSWKGPLDKIDQHISERHIKSLQFGDVVSDLNVDFSNQYFIYKSENQLFRFNLRNGSDKNKELYVWSLDHITDSASDKPQYLFLLNFIDQTNSNKVLTVNEYCFKWSEHNDETGSTIIIHPKMLKPFINQQNHIYYNLHVKSIAQQ